jgi:hypothetical protein
MPAASVSRLAQAVKAGPGAFGHPGLDVFGQPAPDRAPGHAQLLVGQQVHEHRHGDPPPARAAQELPHSRACSVAADSAAGSGGGSVPVRTGTRGSRRRAMPGSRRATGAGPCQRADHHDWSPRQPNYPVIDGHSPAAATGTAPQIRQGVPRVPVTCAVGGRRPGWVRTRSRRPFPFNIARPKLRPHLTHGHRAVSRAAIDPCPAAGIRPG